MASYTAKLLEANHSTQLCTPTNLRIQKICMYCNVFAQLDPSSFQEIGCHRS